MKNALFFAIIGCCLAVTCCSTLEAQVLRRAAISRPVGLVSPIRRTANVSSNWYPYVIARGADRALIRQTPMEYRPNRPMHFWGK